MDLWSYCCWQLDANQSSVKNDSLKVLKDACQMESCHTGMHNATVGRHSHCIYCMTHNPHPTPCSLMTQTSNFCTNNNFQPFSAALYFFIQDCSLTCLWRCVQKTSRSNWPYDSFHLFR